jgi:hypothetical protein
MMKKPKLIVSIIFLVLLVSYMTYSVLNESGSSNHVPTGSIDNFYDDSKNIIKMYKQKTVDLKPLTNEEEILYKQFKELYALNPRLKEQQKSIDFDIYELYTSYFLYVQLKDSKSNKDIKGANDGIEFVLNTLKKYNDDGSKIVE